MMMMRNCIATNLCLLFCRLFNHIKRITAIGDIWWWEKKLICSQFFFSSKIMSEWVGIIDSFGCFSSYVAIFFLTPSFFVYVIKIILIFFVKLIWLWSNEFVKTMSIICQCFQTHFYSLCHPSRDQKSVYVFERDKTVQHLFESCCFSSSSLCNFVCIGTITTAVKEIPRCL